MIGAMLKIVITLTVHIILFIFYPDTGKYGNAYFWISLSLWSSVWLTFHFKFAAIKNFLFPLSFLIKAAAVAIMIFFITVTMPQDDGRPVIYKLAKIELPDKQQIQRGKIKYLNHFTFSGSVKEGILLKKAKQAMRKLKEDDI